MGKYKGVDTGGEGGWGTLAPQILRLYNFMLVV